MEGQDLQHSSALPVGRSGLESDLGFGLLGGLGVFPGSFPKLWQGLGVEEFWVHSLEVAEALSPQLFDTSQENRKPRKPKS